MEIYTAHGLLGMRTIQNSLTSYFNFEMGEKTIVLVSIAFFGILGWFISRKKTDRDVTLS
ncbi:hypothetical protein QJQ58_27255 [Paenibacillus dendritiformis]|uniref:hypothetical protein n=1 Tax=Paenibacillus dendritiformis TaxID=130049 RepID=UPI00248BB9F7|nr:hypothetical protein [Paenibacillus dendritiformis]WGU94153.1 hypothetical protein QJQ58_27255 [Paenibacillus dendritiformis]